MIPIPPDVQAALAADFGLTSDALTFLGGGHGGSDGTTFRCEQAGQPRVFKILAFPANASSTLLHLDERLKFARFLGEHGARIVYPLSRHDGSLFTCRPAGENTFVAYIMQHAPGRHPQPADWTPDLLRTWGKMVGATHRITRQYPTWQHSETAEGPVLGWQEEWQDFYNWSRDPEVKAYWLVMREKLASLPIERDCFGFIHNDPHMENILVEGDGSMLEQMTLLDFDVANYHWFITDISIAVQSVLFRGSGGMEAPVKDLPAARRFLTHFMEGYETEYHLDSFWLDQLNLFINYRRALLFTVMQDWIETKPELLKSWKEMILTEAPVF